MARINDLAGRYADDATADAAFVANGWDKSEGVVYYDTTLSQFKKWDEVASAWVFDAGTPGGGDPAFPGIETVNCVFVDKGTNAAEDGSAQFPFHTIQDAVTAAVALVPSVTNPVTIYVYPGIYTEQVALTALASQYITLKGIAGPSHNSGNVTALSADAVVITSTSSPVVDLFYGNKVLEDITVHSDTAGVIRIRNQGWDYPTTLRRVKFAGSGTGDNVYHHTWANHLYMEDCIFQSTALNQLNITGGTFWANRLTFVSGHNSRPIVLNGVGDAKFIDCDFMFIGADIGTGVPIQITSGSRFEFHSCKFRTDAADPITVSNAIVRLVVANCEFQNSHSRYGIALNAAVTDLRVVNNVFQAPPGWVRTYAQITSFVANSGVFSNNYMCSGLGANITTQDRDKHVYGSTDCYQTLQVAMTQATTDGDVIHLHDNVTLTAALTANTNDVTIEGHGHSITRAAHGTICDLTQDRKLTFRNCHLDGALIVSGTGAKLELIDCKFDGAIDVQNTTDASTLIKLTHTDIISDTTAKYPLYVNDVDPVIEIYDCYLEAPSVAGSGYAAIELVAKNDNLVVVQSDLIGYVWSGGEGEEILFACPINGHGNDPSVTVYHCGLNGALSTVTNTIATPYNVEDTAIGLPRHRW